MNEFSPVSSLEVEFTLGKEVSQQERIKGVSKKSSESGVFDNFHTEQQRTDKLNEIVSYASEGVFSSYKDLVDRSCSENYNQAKIDETFDILRRGFSSSINNNQRLQTSLNVGGISDFLPDSAKYNNMGNSRLDLAKGILEVTITNPKIRDIYSRVSEIRDDYDLSFPKERKKAAEKIEPLYDQLLDLGDESKSEGFKEQWLQSKAYFATQIGVLYRDDFSMSDGSVDRADQAAVLGRVAEAVEKMTDVAGKVVMATEKVSAKVTSSPRETQKNGNNGEKKFNSRSGLELIKHPTLPETEEDQLEYIEERLKIIENYKTGNVKSELSLNELTYPLFALLTTEGGSVISQRLLDIINTRLTLKDISAAMRGNNGSMGEGGRELVGTISRLGQQGYDMSPDVMKSFFNNFGDNDLKVGEERLRTNLKTAEAWDLMEIANFEYQKMVSEIFASGGKRSVKLEKMITDSGIKLEDLSVCKPLTATKGTQLEGQVFNYYNETEGGKPRAAMVRRYMIDNLMDKYGISEERAERSVRLSEEMYFASLENCVVDWDFLNGDQYAEMVHLKFIRKLDGQMNKKGKPTGPSASLNHIDTLTPGWIRSFCGIKNPSVKITSDQIRKALDNGRLTGKEQWVPHFISVIAGKVWAAKQLITSETTPATKDVLKTQYWKGVNDLFNKVDGQVGVDGDKDGVTKTAWVAGLFQLILTSRDSEWQPSDIRLLKRILTKDVITNQESGTGQPFLTEKQWVWIEDTLKVNKNIRRIGLLGTLDRLFGGGKR